MELSKVMEERRSVRHYNDKKLDKRIVCDILNYGIMAPSADNRQPWHFVASIIFFLLIISNFIKLFYYKKLHLVN